MRHLPSYPDPFLAQDSTIVSYGSFSEQVVKGALFMKGKQLASISAPDQSRSLEFESRARIACTCLKWLVQ